MMIKNAMCNAMIIQTRHRNHEEIHEMMRSDWSEWFRAAGIKPYSDFLWLCSAFLREMSHVRCCADVLTATARSIGDMTCLRTSFMHVSMRAPCLIDLLWRRYRLMSSWAIDYFITKKRIWGVSSRQEINPNRSKTTCPMFCRIVCWFWLVAWDRVSRWHIIRPGDHGFGLTPRPNRMLSWRYQTSQGRVSSWVVIYVISNNVNNVDSEVLGWQGYLLWKSFTTSFALSNSPRSLLYQFRSPWLFIKNKKRHVLMIKRWRQRDNDSEVDVIVLCLIKLA